MRNAITIFLLLFCTFGQAQILKRVIIAQQSQDTIPPPPPPAPIDPKAFPTAFGGGSNASGGRGKVLCIVNTLDRNASLTYYAADPDTGQDEYYTGGLFPALQNSAIGYIVFNVSGNITLGTGGTSTQFGFNGIPNVNNKTIFGQSAPQGGITITGGTFRFNGLDGNASNIIIRYIRSRPRLNRYGTLTSVDDAWTWGLLFFGGEDVIVDHCSFSFAQDKAVGAAITTNTNRIRRMTFQHNFIQDSNTLAYVAINPKRPGNPELYVDLISFNRNAMMGRHRTPNLSFSGRAEKVNNIAQNIPFRQSSVYFALRLNEIGNYFGGISSKNEVREDVIAYTSGAPLIWTRNNYFQGIYDGTETGANINIWTKNDNTTIIETFYLADAPFEGFINPITPTTASAAFTDLITNGDVGAYKYLDNDGYVQTYRDSFDTSQLAIIAANGSYTGNNVSNWVLPTIPNNTRPSEYDSDNDGMADEWEIREFGDLSQSYKGDYNNNGYTNIEDYMNQVDE
jgi:hypothetical protein